MDMVKYILSNDFVKMIFRDFEVLFDFQKPLTRRSHEFWPFLLFFFEHMLGLGSLLWVLLLSGEG
jgi:hypothetical protein